MLAPERFVSADKRSSNVGLALLEARALRGKRAFGKAPRNRSRNTTLLASKYAGKTGP